MKHEDGLEKEVRSALDQLDRLTARSTPPLAWFEQFAARELQLRRKRLQRELALFILIAPFVVFAVIASLAYGVGMYFMLQTGAFAVLALSALFVRGQRKKRWRS